MRLAGFAKVAMVGDVFFWRVRRPLACEVFVDLVHGLESSDGFEGIHCYFARAFARTVVHHGNRGGQASDKDGIVAHMKSVMVDLIKINRPNHVFWTNQLLLGVPSEIAAIKKAANQLKS